VKLFRDRAYEGARIRDDSPFVMQPALFNSLLIRSNRDLARIARAVGAEPAPYVRWADLTAAGMERLWDDARGDYADYDVRAGEKVSAWTAAGFAPLYAGVPSAGRAARMLDRLERVGRSLGDGLWVVPIVAVDDPQFEPARYWRGPVWPIIQWVLSHGTAAYGRTSLSERIRWTAVELARRGGFWEHYNPLTGAGQGEPTFAWTAGLVLDLLVGPPSCDGGDRP
jgi:neutral trehalase